MIDTGSEQNKIPSAERLLRRTATDGRLFNYVWMNELHKIVLEIQRARRLIDTPLTLINCKCVNEAR